MNTLHFLRSSLVAIAIPSFTLVAGCAAPDDEADESIGDSEPTDSEDVGSSEAAASTGTPRIDVYVTAGYGRSQACTRTVAGSKKTYYCRDLKTVKATTVYPRAHWMQPKGDISGGKNLIVQDANGVLWEACVAVKPRATKVTCTAKATNVASQTYGSAGSWYTRAASNVAAQIQCGYDILQAVKSPETGDLSSCTEMG